MACLTYPGGGGRRVAALIVLGFVCAAITFSALLPESAGGARSRIIAGSTAVVVSMNRPAVAGGGGRTVETGRSSVRRQSFQIDDATRANTSSASILHDDELATAELTLSPSPPQPSTPPLGRRKHSTNPTDSPPPSTGPPPSLTWIASVCDVPSDQATSSFRKAASKEEEEETAAAVPVVSRSGEGGGGFYALDVSDDVCRRTVCRSRRRPYQSCPWHTAGTWERPIDLDALEDHVTAELRRLQAVTGRRRRGRTSSPPSQPHLQRADGKKETTPVTPSEMRGACSSLSQMSAVLSGPSAPLNWVPLVPRLEVLATSNHLSVNTAAPRITHRTTTSPAWPSVNISLQLEGCELPRVDDAYQHLVQLIAIGRLRGLPAERHSIVLLRGDSIHRGSAFAWVNVFRKLPAAFDRRLHSDTGYIVTSQGDAWCHGKHCWQALRRQLADRAVEAEWFRRDDEAGNGWKAADRQRPLFEVRYVSLFEEDALSTVRKELYGANEEGASRNEAKNGDSSSAAAAALIYVAGSVGHSEEGLPRQDGLQESIWTADVSYALGHRLRSPDVGITTPTITGGGPPLPSGPRGKNHNGTGLRLFPAANGRSDISAAANHSRTIVGDGTSRSERRTERGSPRHRRRPYEAVSSSMPAFQTMIWRSFHVFMGMPTPTTELRGAALQQHMAAHIQFIIDEGKIASSLPRPPPRIASINVTSLYDFTSPNFNLWGGPIDFHTACILREQQPQSNVVYVEMAPARRHHLCWNVFDMGLIQLIVACAAAGP